MPGYLGGMGNIGSLALGADRFMSNQPASLYDPNQFINPMLMPYMGMYLQPQLMRAMENFQNPQLMLPQNSGAFLGQALGRLFGGGQQSGPQQQQQSQDPQQVQAQALQAQVFSLRNAALQQGMAPGQATAVAVQKLMADPKYQDQASQAILDRFQQQAIKEGYKPDLAQAAQYNLMNFQNQKDGSRRAMTLAQWQALPQDQQQQWVRAENTPQVATNRVQEVKLNGLYYSFKTNPDGSLQLIGTSTSPKQYINSNGTNVNLTADDVQKNPGLLKDLTTGSYHDMMISSLGNQETFTKNFDDMSQMVEGLLKAGATSGKAGDIYSKVDDLVGSIGSFANTVGDTNTFNQVVKGHAGLDDIISRFKVQGTQAVRLNTALNALTYQYWRAQNPTGRLSPKELVEARDELIGDSSDPNTMIQSIEDKRNMLINNFQNAAKNASYVPKWYGSNASILAPSDVPEDIQNLVRQYGTHGTTGSF